MKSKLTLLVILIITFLVSQSQSQQKNGRYKFETEKIYTKGKCPDSIRASVYDSMNKKILHYSFKNNAAISRNAFYYTVKASEKGSLVAGQVMDCSMKTIATILVSNKNGKEEVTVKAVK
ncbi:hypothetical protein EZ428_07765 [Pedobacter frigiditerrae]|uniref:Uncharacterized protein n=1 Tax=Pedobacter frigiditerrae TaxID=2530452 RepID=A0A4R0MWL4_9SPHI|nr:hypothetical protein [Pedobacter frigiditerrae]TCC91649.1 hypothetical protein EZ428_07765 [Pedobacter frigiditerrae]